MRHRTRKTETQLCGKGDSLEFKTVEKSAFGTDGNIQSLELTEVPSVQGVLPHSPTDVQGQCQSCLEFTTKLILCDLCWTVLCLPCAVPAEQEVVCPACARFLKKRRWIQMLRKLIVEPFVERLG